MGELGLVEQLQGLAQRFSHRQAASKKLLSFQLDLQSLKKLTSKFGAITTRTLNPASPTVAVMPVGLH